MKIYSKLLLVMSILLLSGIGFSQSPPPPNNNDTSNGGGTPVGGGAPIGGGLMILSSLAIAYGMRRRKIVVD